MKKIKLLVTGSILRGDQTDLKDSLTGPKCDQTGGHVGCDYDFSWLINNPAALIYSDKVIFTTYCNAFLEQNPLPYYGEKIGKAIKTTFEIAKEFDLIEVKNCDSIITTDLDSKIYKEIDTEREIIAKKYPKNVLLGNEKEVPGQIFIDNQEYCSEFLWSVNASLILSKKWDAETLFSKRAYDYCKYKFGSASIDEKKIGNNISKISAFNNIFNVVLPAQQIFPYFALDDIIGDSVPKNCRSCKKTSECANEYLSEVEETTREYLELRETDEIQQIKGTLEDITNRLVNSKENFTDKDIVREFRKKESKINRELKNAFPRIKYWTNLSMVASAYTGLYGSATGLPLVTYASAAIATASLVSTKMTEYYEDKYRWIGFIQDQRKTKKEPCKKT